MDVTPHAVVGLTLRAMREIKPRGALKFVCLISLSYALSAERADGMTVRKARVCGTLLAGKNPDRRLNESKAGGSAGPVVSMG